jgi:asparagine synthase (glutamine-hydrolysing)
LRRARQFVSGRDEDFGRQYVNWTYFLNGDDKKQLLAAANGTRFLPSERVVQQLLSNGRDYSGNDALEIDLQTFLPDNVLEYTDKMSMAVALEVRVPYLDYEVVEFAHSLPFEYKLKSGKSKRILKDTFADLLPPESARGPKKGFNFPLAAWMRDRFDNYFETQMNQQSVRAAGLFNWEYIQRLRNEHRSGKNDNSYALFSLVMFDVWYRKYISGARAYAA